MGHLNGGRGEILKSIRELGLLGCDLWLRKWDFAMDWTLCQERVDFKIEYLSTSYLGRD